MYYYMYEIKNNVDGKIYIGVHETENLKDEYFGSGKLIQRAIKKHGKENFTKTILEFFCTREDMYKRESELVNDEFVLREDTYNLGNGGYGGTIKQNRKPFTKFHTEETKLKIARGRIGKVATEETRKKLRDNNWAKKDPEKQRLHAIEAGKQRYKNCESTNHSLETRKKIADSLKGIKQEQITCPHCGKVGGDRAMKRHHFDNCKFMVNESEVVEPNDCESL